jgi:predicted AAA+ superfamily ATPase
VLEASYILYLLPPHFRNFNKRLTKTPKLYFYDTGLACWLLGIQDANQLISHSLRGALFETWVISELIKARFNRGLPSNLYFWRDSAGNEIDILIDQGEQLAPVEVKSGKTIAADFFVALRKWCTLAGAAAGPATLVYAGSERQRRTDVTVLPWHAVAEIVPDER